MLVASYALLIPGLTQVIFSFNIVVNVLGHRIDVQPEKGHAVACTETITGLVNLLWRTGSRTGAVLIVLYAVVVPILKPPGDSLKSLRALEMSFPVSGQWNSPATQAKQEETKQNVQRR